MLLAKKFFDFYCQKTIFEQKKSLEIIIHSLKPRTKTIFGTI